VDHPAVSGGTFRLSYGTGGTYSGLDRFARVLEQLWVGSAGTTTLDRFRYGYDRMGNRLWRETYGNNAHSEYYGPIGTGYDDLDRLIQAKRGTLSGSYGTYGAPTTVAHQEIHGLDGLGNWRRYWTYNGSPLALDLDQTRSHNSVNEIDTDDTHGDTDTGAITQEPGADWFDPVYDAAGNMVKGPDVAAPATQRRFVYDAWNRLLAYTDSGDNVIAEYRYDGLNRRIAKLVAGADWDRTDYYYNEAWQVLEERFAEDVDEADKDDPATTMRCQYIWDIRYVDAPVVRFRDTNGDGTADDTLYYCTDANMNVTALVNASDGSVAERYEYDPYGRVLILDADWTYDGTSDWGNEILYAGYRHDPESALWHVRNRYYHATLGRWMSRDPKVYVDSFSLVLYAKGMPTASLDPFGQQRLDPGDDDWIQQCVGWTSIQPGWCPTCQSNPCHDPRGHERTCVVRTRRAVEGWILYRDVSSKINDPPPLGDPPPPCDGEIVPLGAKASCDGNTYNILELAGSPWSETGSSEWGEKRVRYKHEWILQKQMLLSLDFKCQCSYLPVPFALPWGWLAIAECEWVLVDGWWEDMLLRRQDRYYRRGYLD